MTSRSYSDRPPDPSELEALAAEFRYEYVMMATAGMSLDALAPGNDPELAEEEYDLLRNAWVEALLMHTRNIVEFFKSKPTRDDVVAHHYVADWTEADGGPELAWLDGMTRSINKRMAHITAYRVRVPRQDDGRGVHDVCLTVHRLWDQFRLRLTEQQAEWFQIYDPDEVDLSAESPGLT
jgi:hypothetical protein